MVCTGVSGILVDIAIFNSEIEIFEFLSMRWRERGGVVWGLIKGGQRGLCGGQIEVLCIVGGK